MSEPLKCSTPELGGNTSQFESGTSDVNLETSQTAQPRTKAHLPGKNRGHTALVEDFERIALAVGTHVGDLEAVFAKEDGQALSPDLLARDADGQETYVVVRLASS